MYQRTHGMARSHIPFIEAATIVSAPFDARVAVIVAAIFSVGLSLLWRNKMRMTNRNGNL